MSKKILIVDDDESIRDAISFALSLEGYELATDRGDSVLDSVSQHRPDLILLDVLLPGVDGRNLAREIKQHAELSHIPIVLVSAHLEAAQEFHQAGAEDFIAKPFDIDQLLDTIANHIKA